MLRRPVSGLAESAGDGGYGGGDVGSGVGGDGEDEEGVLVVGRVVIVERGLDDGDVEVGEEGGGGHPCQANTVLALRLPHRPLYHTPSHHQSSKTQDRF